MLLHVFLPPRFLPLGKLVGGEGGGVVGGQGDQVVEDPGALAF